MKSGSRKNFFFFGDRVWPSWSEQQAHDGRSLSPVIPPPLAIITALLFIQFEPNAVASKEKSILILKKKTTKNERHRNFIRKNWKEVSQIDLWNEELCIQRLLWRVNNELSKWKANNRLAVYALDAVSACVCIVYISMENVFHNHQHLLYGC